LRPTVILAGNRRIGHREVRGSFSHNLISVFTDFSFPKAPPSYMHIHSASIFIEIFQSQHAKDPRAFGFRRCGAHSH
jgi:hypothetical protein